MARRSLSVVEAASLLDRLSSEAWNIGNDTHAGKLLIEARDALRQLVFEVLEEER